MRSTTSFTLHAVLAACLVAFAASSAAAGDAYLKIGDIKGSIAGGCTGEGCDDSGSTARKGEWIELQSYQWGATEGVGGTPAATAKMQAGGGKAQGQVAGGVQVAAGDVDGDGVADAVAVHDVKAPRDASSGMPTGKRQHNPVTFTKPLDKGSVTLRGVVTGCAVGKHYDEATLLTLAYKYEFRDVIITSCATGGGGGGGGASLPMEQVSFNYAKIVTKATTAADKAQWDLKKQEAR